MYPTNGESVGALAVDGGSLHSVEWRTATELVAVGQGGVYWLAFIDAE